MTSDSPSFLHAATCTGGSTGECDGRCIEMPRKPRVLPSSHDERISLAARAILRCCGPDDIMDDGFERVFESPVLVEFRVLVPSMPAAIELNHRAADAIMFESGFSAISYSLPKEVGGGYVCAIRVPVGAP